MRRLKRLVFLVLLITFSANQHSGSQEVDLNDIPLGVDNGPVSLFLEVFINGHPKKKIAEFRDEGDKTLAAPASELREIGIDIPGNIDDKTWVNLSQINNTTYNYNEGQQTVDILIDAKNLELQTLSARPIPKPEKLLQSGSGAFINYSLHGGVETNATIVEPKLNGVSATLESWMFHPIGAFQNGMILQLDGDDGEGSARRLETFFSTSDVEKQTNLRVGDFISSGLSWTSPVRLGGVRFKRNFATRPDIVRQPLPSFQGTAAVPSTVDVFLGNLRLSSTEVEPGRFQLEDIPAPSANGELRVVIQDASGGSSEQTLSYGTDATLLRKGTFDFSVETGVARIGFGSTTDSYGNDILANASIRYGITDKTTLEGHGEFSSSLVNLGTGFVTTLGQWGTLNGAVAASLHDGNFGGLFAGGYKLAYGRFNFGANTLRQSNNFQNLAGITSKLTADGLSPIKAVSFDRVFGGFRSEDGSWNAALGYAHTENSTGDHDHFGTLSFGKRLSRDAQLSLHSQTDLTNPESFSVFAGVSMQLGPDHSNFSGVTVSGDTVLTSSSISKGGGNEVGEVGYNVNLSSDGESHKLRGSANRRTEMAHLRGYGQIDNTTASINGQVTGSISYLNGSVSLSRRIQDSFIIVDAGAANVTVFHENRKAGKTDKDGKLLLPDIRSFDTNTISIDPKDLPLDSAITQARQKVAIRENSGATVVFEGAHEHSVKVSAFLRDRNNKPIKVGSTLKIDGSDEEHMVAYDGQIFIPITKHRSRLIVSTPSGSCKADLIVKRAETRLINLGDIKCR